MDLIKIVLLGDSITEGIGSRKINYSNDLKNILEKNNINAEIYNLAVTGTTVEYGLSIIQKIKALSPDYVIIMYGSVDVQVRPNMETNYWKILTLTPKRYKDVKGMLNPRPFSSKKFPRNILDALDNFYRWIWKKVVIKTQGTMQYLEINEFTKLYEELVNTLSVYKLILCSTIYLDEKIYGENTINNYIKTNEAIKKIAKTKNAGYVDVYNLIKNVTANDWSNALLKDHFHPNEKRI